MSIRYGVRDQHIQSLEDRITELEDALSPFADFGEIDVWKGTVWEKNPTTAILVTDDGAGVQSLFMKQFLKARKVYLKGD